MLKRIRFAYYRIRFWLLYQLVQRRTKEIHALTAEIGCALREVSPSYSAIGWFLFNQPGYNREHSPICWETPIAVLVWLDGKPAFGMGIELFPNRISIRQLHGVAGTVIPRELHQWPRILVSTVVSYAQEAGIAEVRLYRAHQDLFYQDPHFEVPEGQTREEAVAAIQQRMRRRYDGTARQLGFRMRADWGELNTKT